MFGEKTAHGHPNKGGHFLIDLVAGDNIFQGDRTGMDGFCETNFISPSFQRQHWGEGLTVGGKVKQVTHTQTNYRRDSQRARVELEAEQHLIPAPKVTHLLEQAQQKVLRVAPIVLVFFFALPLELQRGGEGRGGSDARENISRHGKTINRNHSGHSATAPSLFSP